MLSGLFPFRRQYTLFSAYFKHLTCEALRIMPDHADPIAVNIRLRYRSQTGKHRSPNQSWFTNTHLTQCPEHGVLVLLPLVNECVWNRQHGGNQLIWSMLGRIHHSPKGSSNFLGVAGWIGKKGGNTKPTPVQRSARLNHAANRTNRRAHGLHASNQALRRLITNNNSSDSTRNKLRAIIPAGILVIGVEPLPSGNITPAIQVVPDHHLFHVSLSTMQSKLD